MLIFSSFETTLSFLMKLPWEWVLFFFGWEGAWDSVCYARSIGIFFQFGIVQDVTCPALTLWILGCEWFFLLDWEFFITGTCVLLKCLCVVLSFLKAERRSLSVDGP